MGRFERLGGGSDPQLAAVRRMAQAEEASADKNGQNWMRVQQSLTDASEAARAPQSEHVRQGEVLRQVVEATGQIARLEETLNGNLSALAGAQHFEETLLNLSG